MNPFRKLALPLTVYAFGPAAPALHAQPAPPLSWVCHYNYGPKTGLIENFAGVAGVTPAPVGAPCTDGISSGGIAVAFSSFCYFYSGPLAGQVINYAPRSPLAMGTPCTDGVASNGTVR